MEYLLSPTLLGGSKYSTADSLAPSHFIVSSNLCPSFDSLYSIIIPFLGSSLSICLIFFILFPVK